MKCDKNNNTLQEDIYKFMLISCQRLCRMRNISDKSCRGNQNTHFMFTIFFFFAATIMPFHGIMWKKMVERERP